MNPISANGDAEMVVSSLATIPSDTTTNSIWRSRTSITSRTKTKSPQTNGICEPFHRTVLNELQVDLDAWVNEYNESRPHQPTARGSAGRHRGDVAIRRELAQARPPWTEFIKDYI
jgi:transposase InsO family protein